MQTPKYNIRIYIYNTDIYMQTPKYNIRIYMYITLTFICKHLNNIMYVYIYITKTHIYYLRIYVK